jgi:hypothetical protein
MLLGESPRFHIVMLAIDTSLDGYFRGRL